LHRRYAGDVVKVTVARGKETFDRELTLIEKLEPYRRPFFGLLAERSAEPGDGVKIRYVFDGSPAAKAGLKPGDVITKFNDTAVRSRDELRNLAADLEPEKKATFAYLRDGETKTIDVEAAAETNAIPAKLPQTARKVAADDDDKTAAPKPVTIKVAEMKNAADLYVPPDYDDAVPHGLVVLLHPQGGFTDKTTVERWRDRCRTANLLLLVPKGVDGKWTPNDLEFIKKAIDRTAESYRVDAARVAAIGYEEGGTVAMRAAGSMRERIRGVAVVNCVPPTFNGDNEPLHPTSFFIATAKDFSGLARVKTAVEQLRERHFPVALRELPKGAEDWNDAGAAELLRWLDALDRI
jgi:serine protease Do